MAATKLVPVRVVARDDDDPTLSYSARSGSRAALEALVTQVKHDEQVVGIVGTLEASPPDGALATYRALREVVGAVASEEVAGGLFGGGPKPPQEIVVPTGVGTTEQVPWGKFTLPALKGGVVEFGVEKRPDGTVIFAAKFEVQRTYELVVRQVLAKAKEILATSSIYRGKAFAVNFRDADGDPLAMPDVRFLDLSKALPLIFDADMALDFEVNVLWPLRRWGQPGAPDLPAGFSLVGAPGTGKTQALYEIGRNAVGNGITVVQVEDPRDFVKAHQLARLYQPAVVQMEDIDQVALKERDALTNQILDALSGVRSRNTAVVSVVTTNHYNRLPEPLTRKGRFDKVFFLRAPTTSTAMEELLRAYASGVHLEATSDELEPHARRLVALGLRPCDVAAVVAEAIRAADYRLGGSQEVVLWAQDFAPAISSVAREAAEKTEASRVEEVVSEGGQVRAGLEAVARALIPAFEGGTEDGAPWRLDEALRLSGPPWHELDEDDEPLLRAGGAE